ncbi:odorant receptor 43a-like isoform X2 [Nilaparvata lugens]|nr:odorant receptor 43a-like isoform X2 [Nilaparvata lugens]XP_039291552.1 odorant receptor 43a-like isoform X2 [Nilaparvata lugens]XP_039291553.1 odorant receptor 43a-like isoform X2 [Nilaparvata lugens]
MQVTIMLPSCVDAYSILKATELRKAAVSVIMFFFTNLILFTIYNNGQQIFNENDRLRKSLLEVPWTDKPRWLRQSMHIMLTQANRDVQIKPYGIFVLNYMSFADLMKFTFSVGNVLYTRKQLTSQT